MGACPLIAANEPITVCPTLGTCGCVLLFPDVEGVNFPLVFFCTSRFFDDRRWKNMTPATISAKPANPPITPPAIAPAWFLLFSPSVPHAPVPHDGEEVEGERVEGEEVGLGSNGITTK